MRNKKGVAKRLIRWGLSVVGVGLLWGLSASAQDVGTAEIEIIPPNPTPHDIISIRLFGMWPNSCVPMDPQVAIPGNKIRIDTFNPGEICLTVITPWELMVSINPLPAAIYQVTVIHHTPFEQLQIGQKVFTVRSVVGGSVTGMSPRRVVCWNLTTGQRVVIPNPDRTWNCEEAGFVIEPGNRVLVGVIGTVD
jgi:hypothetical protein